MNNAYNYPTTAIGASCPNCGYCSHCGRGGITSQPWCGGFPQAQCGGTVNTNGGLVDTNNK